MLFIFWGSKKIIISPKNTCKGQLHKPKYFQYFWKATKYHRIHVFYFWSMAWIGTTKLTFWVVRSRAYYFDIGDFVAITYFSIRYYWPSEESYWSFSILYSLVLDLLSLKQFQVLILPCLKEFIPLKFTISWKLLWRLLHKKQRRKIDFLTWNVMVDIVAVCWLFFHCVMKILWNDSIQWCSIHKQK